MSGDSLLWFTVFLSLVVVALIMVIAVILLPRVLGTRSMTARFYCPWFRRNVVVRYLADARRRPFDVISCTAFADPITVTCAKHCLDGAVPTDLKTGEKEATA